MAIDGKTRTAGDMISILLEAIDLRANSTLITIFGDAISQRGGEIWLGNLITLAASLNISERLVRTGVYRLSNEGWLQSQTRGRRAYYSLTKAGAEKFHEAQRRIYAREPVAWDGEWRLIQLLSVIPQTARTAFRRELGWLGFGQISPTLFAHPTESMDAIARILRRHNLTGDTLVFRATLAEFVTGKVIQGVVRDAWHLDALNKEYEHFITTFSALEATLETAGKPNGQEAFALRILLIHDFRRALLKDPVLPDRLLPTDWVGGKARDLCARLYLQLAADADAYLVSVLESGTDDIPDLPDSYHERFTGYSGKPDNRSD
ncbi:MAG: phenylacetic acid degradation operon negative regulatory protein PaaX [Fimbriimonadaceae bacterium]|nr:phenylacetic acid degradation operon negative regulatory protein PaaX [Alphaproteobacteria bacterium]